MAKRQHRRHVADAGLLEARAQGVQDPRLDVDGEHAPLRPDPFGRAQREIPGTGADVADRLTGREGERVQDLFRLLPGGAARRLLRGDVPLEILRILEAIARAGVVVSQQRREQEQPLHARSLPQPPSDRGGSHRRYLLLRSRRRNL